MPPVVVEEGLDLWCLATGLALVALLLLDPGAASASQGGTSLSLSGGWTTRLTHLMAGLLVVGWPSVVLFLSGSVLKLVVRLGSGFGETHRGGGLAAAGRRGNAGIQPPGCRRTPASRLGDYKLWKSPGFRAQLPAR